ncbi:MULTISPECIES: hypothetical protein [unclassified Streptomyces]|uniref:hypothetical protein n=1 Tax=unclassified Streptomyces TaxID=2593676 RepID=UPI0024A87C98|nr:MULTISPECIES: hypothetical protein [unclassified Streptomyces]
MPSRFEYERAVRHSDLPSLSRLLALTVATWADVRTGTIPDRLQPSLTTLEDATGMVRASVRTHLNKLEAGGWLKRDRPAVAAARSKKARTKYKLLIPKGAAVPDSDGIELGQELPNSGAGAALVDTELGQELPQPRAGAAPELGQEMSTTRAGAALKSSFSSNTTAEYQQAGEHDPSYGIPADARPLVDALTNADVRVRWPFKGNEWFPVLALIKKAGVPALTEHAVKVAARTPVESAKYFLKGWAELPPMPAAGAERPALRAVSGGGWQPYTNPTDVSAYSNGF